MERPKSEIKVTDKRIFTAEGEIREEFKKEVTPVDPAAAKPDAAPVATETAKPAPEAAKAAPAAGAAEPPAADRRSKSVADKALNPGTPFADFVEPLIAQAYMSLGLLRNPYDPKPKLDAAAARQMIEMLTMLKEKTNGNLTADEDDFLSTHLGELKLAFVQRTKSLS
jgi:hypothetical protein